MELKFYLVLQGPDEEIVIWKRSEYENYIKGAVGVGAGSAYRVITHFDPGESLIGNRLTFPNTPTHDLTDIEREAAELYPYDPKHDEDHIGEIGSLRLAHISCAKQFIDKVRGLESRIKEMEQALSQIWMDSVAIPCRKEGVSDKVIQAHWETFKAKHNL